MRSTPFLAGALALLLCAPARADLFSPGPLAKGHAELEGLKNCTSCHESGQQLSPERCLDCHRELTARIAQGKGLHGRIPAAERACETCHHEHQGREFKMVEWTPSQKGFDHARTGFALVGKHAGQECAKCHTPRLVADPAIKKLLERNPSRETYLGLPTKCSACHFDEHRGQLGVDCDRCHTEKGFKQTAPFDHAKTAFALEGKHAQAACAKCHKKEEDKATSKDAFPAPREASFIKFKNLPHGNCTDCHKDSHNGRFGPTCVNCHTPAGWKKVRSLEKERGFHDKTRFKLRGAHAAATCRACHGQPPRYKGTAFKECGDCHADAHVGQIAGLTPGKPPDCRRCHGLDSFKPPLFELEDHAKLEYPLEGAHRAVACALCHRQDPHLSEKIPAKTREAFRKKGRPERFSFAKFEVQADRCETCHADPHLGQFAPGKRCQACHAGQTFREVRFDHAKDSRFKLDGKHATVACERCHRVETFRGAPVVRFKPLDVACASCHEDQHAGQFAVKGVTDCARCHNNSGFKPVAFEHQPPATGFTLEGQHAQVACEKCHPVVEVAEGVQTRRYKPLPRDCPACHEDFHRGAFQGHEFLSGQAPEGLEKSSPHSPADTNCSACHSVAGFRGASIVHERTGFPLKGAHARASCSGCHVGGFDTSLPTRCAWCHQDVHGGDLGTRCEGCHDEERWLPKFSADAHRRSNFPLTGRHSLLPCEECHRDARERGFRASAATCYDCHERDFQRTAFGSVDHAAAGFGTACQQCHDPWRFSPARYGQHDNCFQLSRGPHSGIRCLDCHTSLSGTQATGTCYTGTASCTKCHEHTCAQTDRRHTEVQGYQCKDRKCYECHRFSQGGGG